MNDFLSKTILVLLDILAIWIAVFLAYQFRELFQVEFGTVLVQSLEVYSQFFLLYLAVITLLFYEGIYNRRYDFWHESRIVLKVLGISFILVMAFLAMTKNVEQFSRAVITLSFLFMAFFIPLFKNIGKKVMFAIGLWRHEAVIYGNIQEIKDELFNNHYLGYIPAKDKKSKTVFINSHGSDLKTLRSMIEQEIDQKHEVIFIPLIDEYDLTQSQIYELSNTRNNLIVFQNRLKSRYRIILKSFSDLLLIFVLLPLLLPVLGFIALLIKKDEADSPVLFNQERMGENEVPFVCYKFRTMKCDSDAMLQSYLKDHPEEVVNYEKYHKYENDPRVTKIGKFLRKTSLDELPQIFNVLKGEMSFVGPRPYMLDEKDQISDRLGTVLTVKPGITGLWQVSGRSDVDFKERVEMDVWYIRNWNLWLDFVILLKTLKTVLLRKGAS